MATETLNASAVTLTDYSGSDTAWSSGNSVDANDNVYNYVSWSTSLGSDTFSDWLEVDFTAFSAIDSTSVINSMTAYFVGIHDDSALNVIDAEVQFYDGSSWCAGHTLTNPFSTTESTQSVACTHHTWDNTNVNSAQVRIRLYNCPSSVLVKSQLDHVYITVDYDTVPSGLNLPAVSSVDHDQTVSQPSVTDAGSSAVTDWYVEWASDSAFTTDVGNSGWISISTSTYVRSGLKACETWYYRSKVRNSAGESAWSDTESAYVTVLPSAVTGLSVSSLTTTTLTLSWTAPTKGYDIVDYEYDKGSGWVSIGSTFTSYTVGGLSENTQYTIKIRAVNCIGQGVEASITAYTAVSAPTISKVTPRGYRSLLIELSGSTVKATSYIVKYDIGSGKVTLPAITARDTKFFAGPFVQGKNMTIYVSNTNGDGVESSEDSYR